ncbi:hypothetical protein CI109_103277 [Kwoniella shandongensis]|uniref:Uncharacterized protein n=1 Tax=Kwoniella shandongensis TaxID=1734106 RepID=A0A5M6BU50_9TREE|nr:uncharacterized protein CI109_006051 [Kwoniella shandongensis]KAA5525600.1 hypothetical protein CI109_006051 [Kwoniella shandongensis]
MPTPSLIPSTFLPHLPRSQYSFSPLHPSDLIAHISILRELYLPPIHGGFSASDVFDDEDDDAQRGDITPRRREPRNKLSDGLTERMGGLGLGLNVSLDGASGDDDGTEGNGDDDDEESDDEIQSEDGEELHLDPFEREWAEKWLGGVVRRAQGWIEEHEEEEKSEETKEIEAVLRDATATLAMMAGTSAAGSLTRHLAFPISDALAPALSQLRAKTSPNLALSPETNIFLASLSTSPTSPSILRRALPTPTSPTGSSSSDATRRRRKKSKRPAVLPVLLHDAPMGDHLSVGVQTWGSAILLGRQMALRPSDFGLFLPSTTATNGGVRVLELGAGTGLLSILCRKLLDLHSISTSQPPGLIVATDFLTSVLDNLKICVDLNFPPHLDERGIETSTDISREEGIHIAKLDWTTFPQFMESGGKVGQEEMAPFVNRPFDLVLASDCVYDETHAKLLRDVAGWVLRLPDEATPGDQGGTFHILSPLRPTFAPELESIDTHFPPLSTYTPLAERQSAAKSSSSSPIPPELRGEGLGIARGLKLGARGEGKRGVRGRKGEGRVDEAQGYWWWEVGWG